MSLKPCKVLLVDDSHANIAMLTKVLESEYDIDAANDGGSVLRYIESILPDLILLDIMMPDMDGYEVCRRLKADERTKDIPIVFTASRDEEDDEFRGLELGAIDYITKPFSKAIVRARVRNHLVMKKQRDVLENLSNLDGLTGIPNRRSFDKYLHIEWHRAMRSKEPLSVILMDIDFFKTFNDNYGHLAGDDCLKHVAQSLEGTIKRAADLVARYGGGEFAAVLPATDSDDAVKLADIVRNAIEKLDIEHAFSDVAKHITISQGAATVTPRRNTRPQVLIEAADNALYQAKEAGRNQVNSTAVSHE
ncbi:MAG: diguanylate cyclase [bacterium]|nr:diguanylate cyclase [bacterium]